MRDEKADFFAEYDALASDTSRSLHQDFSANVGRWLEFIETEPPTALLVAGMGQRLNRNDWIQAFGSPSQGMGGGTVRWPNAREARLGAQLDLLRLFARGEWDAVQFAMNFQRTGTTNLNQMTNDVVTHIFQPTARDLRRHFDRNWTDEDDSAPASDRIVRFDHNSEVYREAVESLNRLRDSVAESNDYPDQDDRDQRLSELSATRELLRATQGRVGALKSVGLRCLKYFVDKFVGSIIGKLAGIAFTALVHLIS